MTAGNGAAQARVTENTLERLQEDLNRANHRLSITTGDEIRKRAAYVEASQAKQFATDVVARLQNQLTESTERFHAQRAVDMGHAATAAVVETVTKPVSAERSVDEFAIDNARRDVLKVASLDTVMRDEPRSAESTISRIFGNPAPARTPVGADAFRQPGADANPTGPRDPSGLRDFSDLGADEITGAVDVTQAGEKRRIYRLTSGELVVGEDAALDADSDGDLFSADDSAGVTA
jgi:hypothetical protein